MIGSTDMAEINDMVPDERLGGQKTLHSFFKLPTKCGNKPTHKTKPEQTKPTKECLQKEPMVDGHEGCKDIEGCDGVGKSSTLNNLLINCDKDDTGKKTQKKDKHIVENSLLSKLIVCQVLNDPEKLKSCSVEPMGMDEDCDVREISYLDFLDQNSALENEVKKSPDTEAVKNLNTCSEKCEVTEKTSTLSENVEETKKKECNISDIDESIKLNNSIHETATIKPKRPNKLKKPVKTQRDIVKLTDDKIEGNMVQEPQEHRQIHGFEQNTLKSASTKPVHDNTQHKSELEDPDMLPAKPPKGCRTITNFFATGPRRVSLVKNKHKEDDSTDIVIVAEVHPTPETQSDSGEISMKSNMLDGVKDQKRLSPILCNAVADCTDLDMTITHIETTYVTVENPSQAKVKLSDNDGDLDEEMDYVDQTHSEYSRDVDGDTSMDNSKNGEYIKDDNDNEECIIIAPDGKQHTRSPVNNIKSQTTPKNQKNLKQTRQQNDVEDHVTLAHRTTVTTAMGNTTTSENTTQSTLNFGKTGIVLCKPAAKPPSKSTQVDTKNMKVSNVATDCEEGLKLNKPVQKVNSKSKAAVSHRKQPIAETPSNDEFDDDEASCKTITQGKTKVLDLSAEDEPVTPRKKRVINSVYETKLVDPNNKKTPLKMKFIRMGSLDDETFTKKYKANKQKSRKAQQLLLKAKTVVKQKAEQKTSKHDVKQARSKDKSKKTKNVLTLQPEVPMRRSSRQSSLTASQAISIYHEECNSSHKRKTKEPVLKELKTPKKIHQNVKPGSKEVKMMKESKSPRQPKSPAQKRQRSKNAVKLASIFGKSAGAVKDESLIAISSDEEVELTEEQKAAQRVRQAFLKSGVPQALRKQISLENAIMASEYAPIPSVSHSQQIPEGDFADNESTESVTNVWNLPDKPLHKVTFKDGKDDMISPNTTEMHTLTGCKLTFHEKKMPEDFTPMPCVEGDVLQLLLAEIATDNPTFPVRRFYKHLVARGQAADRPDRQDLQELSENCAVEISANKKRKKPDCPEVDSKSQRKRQKAGDCDLVEREKGKGGSRLTRLSRSKGPEDNKSHQTENVIIGDKSTNKPSTDAATISRDLLWTDKYTPTNSGEILGNISAVKKVKSWLVEWKQRTDLEMRKLQKEQMKQAQREGKSKEVMGNNAGWQGNDDDFDDTSDERNSSDSDYEDRLCNTMLISGPHGTGKTSMVYALAQELGYKVFEVNASQRRSGKQILSQLQEATQSHQVSKENLEAVYADIITGGKGEPVKKPTQKLEKNVPATFANFFKKPTDKTAADVDTKERKQADRKSSEGKAKKTVNVKSQKNSKRKKLRTELETKETTEAGSKKGLNLSSVSVIIFDEVDLVLEEDRGFWAAVQTFMSITKRPIVLTVSDKHFVDKFKGNVERVCLKPAAPENITSYLQLVCLADNVRTSFNQLLPLVTIYNRDLRRLLLSLQLWVASGGSIQQRAYPIHYKKVHLKERTTGGGGEANITTSNTTKAEHSLLTLTADDSQTKAEHSLLSLIADDSRSADEFEMKKTRKCGSRLIINDDDSMSDMQKCEQSKLPDENSSQGDMVTGSTENEIDEQMAVAHGTNIPAINDIVFYSITGGHRWIEDAQPNTLGLQIFQHSNYDLAAEELQSLCVNQRCNLIYANHCHLLPLPKVKSSPAPIQPTTQPKRQSRIANTADLFDSEESNEEFITIKSQKDNTVVETSTDSDKLTNINSEIIMNGSDSKTRVLVTESLSELACFYDTISFIDSHLDVAPGDVEGTCLSEDFGWSSGDLLPGQSDNSPIYDAYYSQTNDCGQDIISCLSVRNIRRAQTRLRCVMDSVQTLDDDLRHKAEELISIGVCDTTVKLRTSNIDITSRTLESTVNAAKKVCNLLPFSSQRSLIVTDYMPMIRSVLKTEQLRMATAHKRRFFHYLDSMVSQLKESTLDILCASFQ